MTPFAHYGDPIAEALFLWNDPVVEEMRAALWPEPEPAPHGARQEGLPPEGWTRLCRLCRQLTHTVGRCYGGTEDGPCEDTVCLWCGYSCLEWTEDGIAVRWHCRACGPPDQAGRCPSCQTYGAWYQVEYVSYCTICEYRRDHRLFWGIEEEP